MPPWSHWYHCTAHTYGTWLRGDPRGWRARHHREHVDGDYKNPPPAGMYSRLHAYSKSLMKREKVEIDDEAIIEFILRSVVERFEERKIKLRIAAFDGVHLHALIQCPDNNPKIEVGIAKQYSTAQLKAHGLAVGLKLKQGQGIWAKNNAPRPIESYHHYTKAADYIRDHRQQGATVYEPQEYTNPLKDFDPNWLLIE